MCTCFLDISLMFHEFYLISSFFSLFLFNLSQDDVEDDEVCVRNFPCIVTPIVYIPLSASSIANIVGEVGSESKLRRSGSLILTKAYASDDELDELNSSLSLISNNGFLPNGCVDQQWIKCPRICKAMLLSVCHLSGMSLVQKKRLYLTWLIRNNYNE